MSAHTPGPWEAIAGVGHRVYTCGKGATLIATAGYLRDKEQEAANARLIAAAPELLDVAARAYSMLVSLHEWRGRHTPVGQRLLCDLRDSIAAATGQDEETVQTQAEAA